MFSPQPSAFFQAEEEQKPEEPEEPAATSQGAAIKDVFLPAHLHKKEARRREVEDDGFEKPMFQAQNSQSTGYANKVDFLKPDDDAVAPASSSS